MRPGEMSAFRNTLDVKCGTSSMLWHTT
ncbi:MAG: hypothetical protein QOC84_2267, partial [Bradyrhizobium sp.]|nr:hypothetical protein [Bradyrhizobium sp.]